MKRLIGIGAIIGCLAAAAQAAPVEEARIACDGEPRLEGVDKDNVEISTALMGVVKVGQPTDDDGDDEVVSPKDFCQAHEGIDAFILPAPRVLDEPQERPEDELTLEAPSRPDRDGGKTVDDEVDDDADDDAAEDDDGAAGATSYALPDGVQYKTLDPQMASAHGCSQSAVGQAPSGWWFALLPLMLAVRRRGEGAR